jgi:hypothetical protein
MSAMGICARCPNDTLESGPCHVVKTYQVKRYLAAFGLKAEVEPWDEWRARRLRQGIVVQDVVEPGRYEPKICTHCDTTFRPRGANISACDDCKRAAKEIDLWAVPLVCKSCGDAYFARRDAACPECGEKRVPKRKKTPA